MSQKKTLLLGFLVLAIISTVWFIRSKKTNISEEKIPAVQTIVAQKQPEVRIISISGFARASDRADVAPMASGRILKIFKHEGDTVKKGELIATIDAQQADAQTQAASASVNALQKTLSDSKKYYDQLIDQSKAVRSDANNSSDTLNESVKSAKRARDLQVQITNDQLVAAEGSLSVAQAGRNNFNIISPFSGKITAVYGREGGFANFSAPLVSISATSGLEIETYLAASDGRSVTLGNPVEFYLANGTPLAGTIINIAPGSDPESLKTFVRIKINDNADLVQIGDFLHGEIQIPTNNQVILVPRSAIVLRGGDHIIFTVDENGITQENKVQTLNEQNDEMQITNGITDGQHIATQGQQYLVTGVKVSEYAAK